MSNLIFIGGIHGAGKGTICHKICEETDLVHITASEILKWDEISELDNKKVDDIQSTQNRLINGLKKIQKDGKSYLLDGHFCLFNSEGVVEKVPLETFEKIAPKMIAVVTTEVQKIKKRLEERDDTIYDLNVLKEMQILEKEYAQEIAVNFNVPFVEVKNEDCQSLISAIQ